MLDLIASRIMPRTTLDIDAAVLRAIKRIARDRGKSIGEVVSEMLAGVLDEPASRPRKLEWKSRAMRARVDLEDKEAVYRTLDE